MADDVTKTYDLVAVQILVHQDGNVRDFRTHVRRYDGKVIDFADACEGTRAAVIQRVRDWLMVVDP
jgi:hypothetical protein